MCESVCETYATTASFPQGVTYTPICVTFIFCVNFPKPLRNEYNGDRKGSDEVDAFNELWLKLVDSDLSKGVVLIGFVLSNIVTAWATRSSSKDKTNSEFLNEVMKRQGALDDHQKEIVEQFKTEFARLKAEMEEAREEARMRKKDNIELFTQKQELLTQVGALKLALDQKEHEYERLREKCGDV